jgi:hypothetical protein
MLPSMSRELLLSCTSAAEPLSLPPVAATWPTSVRGSRHRPSGRLSRPSRFHSMFTPGLRPCAYKSASGLGKWLNRDPINEADSINLYQFVFNSPINASDSYGLDTYICNRQLMIFAPPNDPAPLSRSDPLSHTFIFTSNPDGSNMKTYSWGNNRDTEGWNYNQSEDLQAARNALQQNEAEHLANSSLDPYVAQAFNDLNQPENRHPNCILFGNCKDEAWDLYDKANQLASQPSIPYNVGQENAPPVSACNCNN